MSRVYEAKCEGSTVSRLKRVSAALKIVKDSTIFAQNKETRILKDLNETRTARQIRELRELNVHNTGSRILTMGRLS